MRTVTRAAAVLAAALAAVTLTGCQPPIVYQDGNYVIRGWVPPGAVVYEDGSYRTTDGTTGCIPGELCQGTVDLREGK